MGRRYLTNPRRDAHRKVRPFLPAQMCFPERRKPAFLWGEHRSIVGVLWGQTPISQEQSGIIPGEAGSERGTNAGLFAARSSFPKMSNVGMSHVRSQMEREGSSLDILSRAFFNRPELTSRICKNSPPWQRRGGRAIK